MPSLACVSKASEKVLLWFLRLNNPVISRVAEQVSWSAVLCGVAV
jgi:hypothetical protein